MSDVILNDPQMKAGNTHSRNPSSAASPGEAVRILPVSLLALSEKRDCAESASSRVMPGVLVLECCNAFRVGS